nr:putative capsid [Marmot picobirnavirus]
MKQDQKKKQRFTQQKSGRSRIKNSQTTSKTAGDGYKDQVEDLKSKTNDPSWYGYYPELLQGAASIPFSWTTGTLVDLTGRSPNPSTYIVPGIQAMYLAPSIGHSQTPSSPVNVAATAIYSFVRHANSGSANYDSPDLMIMLLSMTQVYSAITWLMRIYGEASLFSQRNRYFPKGLLRAEGVDYDSVATHLADFRYGINLLINKAASLSVPANMSVFKRAAFLYQNIYTEGTSSKDQVYMYVPSGFWKYDPQPTTGSALTFQPTQYVAQKFDADNLMSYEQLLSYVADLLDPLLASEDINIASGDILKAYGDNGVLKLQALSENYPIVPIFDIAVLEQMKNAVITGLNTLETVDIDQDPETNILISTPRVWESTNRTAAPEAWNYYLNAYNESLFLTTTTGVTDASLVMENSRLMIAGMGPMQFKANEYSDGDNMMYVDIDSGSEICVCALIYTIDPGAEAQRGWHDDRITRCIMYGNYESININLIARSAAFRFRPRFRLIIGNSNEFKERTMDFFDYDNYAVLDPQTISRIHEAALMSEFAVPIINRR